MVRFKWIVAGLLVLVGRGVLLGQGGGSIPRGNDLLPYKKCAPSEITWNVWFYDLKPMGGKSDMVFQVNWDDGSGVINYTYSDDVSEINKVHYDATEDKFYATFKYTYTSRSDGNCSYSPSVQVVVDGELIESSLQNQTVVVWDNDNSNGGVLSLEPHEYQICVGDGAKISFSDISQWNCLPPDEDDFINQDARWIQWIYGTTNQFEEVFIDGVKLTLGNSMASAVEQTISPIEGPIAPLNQSGEIIIPPTTSADIGKVFEITLNNWNQCNPYDAGDDPVLVTARIIVVDKPHIEIGRIEGAYCQNESCIPLSATPAGGVWSGKGISGSKFCPKDAGAGSHTLYYTLSNGSCSAIDSIAVFVHPSPQITAYDDFEICTGASRTLSTSLSREGTPPYRYVWQLDSELLNDPFQPDPIYTSVNSGVDNLQLRVTDQNGCIDTEKITITVAPIEANFPVDSITICEGESSFISIEASGGAGSYDYQWTGPGSALLASPVNMAEAEVLASKPGIYKLYCRVTDAVEAACEATDSMVVEVKELPLPDAGDDQTVCGLECTLDALENIGFSGFWEVIDLPDGGNPMLSEIEDHKAILSVEVMGDYKLRWIESNDECMNSDTITISFIDIPSPQAGEDDEVCGLSYKLNATASIGNATWKQESGPGVAAFKNDKLPDTRVTVSEAGEYHFIWLEDNGNDCRMGDTVMIHFFEVPQAAFAMNDTNVCSPGRVLFSNVSTTHFSGETYLWDLGDGIIADDENPSRDFVNSTRVDISIPVRQVVISPDGCRDTAINNVVVHPVPNANFTPDILAGCSPLSVEFTNTTEYANQYSWQFGDESASVSSQNSSHEFVNTGNSFKYFDVELTAVDANGCSDTHTEKITLYPNKKFDFTFDPDTLCSPAVVEINADRGALNYRWNFGNGLSKEGSAIEVVDYLNDGDRDQTHHVELISTSQYGCLDSITHPLVIHPEIKAFFEIVNNDRGCTPLRVDFRNLSRNEKKVLWSFGDGDESMDMSPTVSHEFVNKGSTIREFEVELRVENDHGCFDTHKQIITVFPNVTADFEANMEGCHPLDVSFTNISSLATSYEWNFGDGGTSSAEDPGHLFTNEGLTDKEYRVSLIATSRYGCVDTAYQTATVYAAPIAEFNLSPLSQVWPDAEVGVVPTTPIGPWSYEWNFGDEYHESHSDNRSIKHSYKKYGNYDITLKVAGTHCSDKVTKTATISPAPPVAAFEKPEPGCPPVEIHFVNLSKYDEFCVWDFGDGTYSNKREPVHTYWDAGIYTVKLKAYNAISEVDSMEAQIEIFENPRPHFSIAPYRVKIPGNGISCVNLTENGAEYLWRFGDGETSTEQNPYHQYETPGRYQVELEVTSKDGCTSSRIDHSSVMVEETIELKCPNAFTPDLYGGNGGTYKLGDPFNRVFYPILAKDSPTEYKLSIFNRWGNLLFVSKDVQIGWDGYYQGKLCTQGVYIWRVECILKDGTTLVDTGDVTLIR